jgi:hypothetical protein
MMTKTTMMMPGPKMYRYYMVDCAVLLNAETHNDPFITNRQTYDATPCSVAIYRAVGHSKPPWWVHTRYRVKRKDERKFIGY